MLGRVREAAQGYDLTPADTSKIRYLYADKPPALSCWCGSRPRGIGGHGKANPPRDAAKIAREPMEPSVPATCDASSSLLALSVKIEAKKTRCGYRTGKSMGPAEAAESLRVRSGQFLWFFRTNRGACRRAARRARRERADGRAVWAAPLRRYPGASAAGAYIGQPRAPDSVVAACCRFLPVGCRNHWLAPALPSSRMARMGKQGRLRLGRAPQRHRHHPGRHRVRRRSPDRRIPWRLVRSRLQPAEAFTEVTWPV
jgi:hypothetical protein